MKGILTEFKKIYIMDENKISLAIVIVPMAPFYSKINFKVEICSALFELNHEFKGSIGIPYR